MFSLIAPQHIHTIEIEPTTFCNAGCPYCSRHKPGTSDVIEDLALEHLPTHLLEKMKQQFDMHQGANQVNVWYCGNYGDSLMHPDFEWLYQYASENFKNVGVHTNGGGRTKDFWRNLGETSKSKGSTQWDKGSTRITFSIDGLEDTNEIYRRKVKWDKLMENVESFINAGGLAEWKMLIFDHNEHQVEEAEALSKKLGFAHFSAEVTTREPPPEEDYQEAVQVAKKKPEKRIERVKQVEEIKIKKTEEIKKEVFKQLKVKEETCISCRGIDDHRMYLNPKGRIWPCCYLSEEYDLSIHQLAKKEAWLVEHYKNDFNNFNTRSLMEVWNEPAWKEITDAWTTRKRELRRCWRSCENGKWKSSNTVIKKQSGDPSLHIQQ
jgi:sulfatase maturation enzyme AslB (radical SAM superfamily)